MVDLKHFYDAKQPFGYTQMTEDELQIAEVARYETTFSYHISNKHAENKLKGILRGRDNDLR